MNKHKLISYTLKSRGGGGEGCIVVALSRPVCICVLSQDCMEWQLWLCVSVCFHLRCSSACFSTHWVIWLAATDAKPWEKVFLLLFWLIFFFFRIDFHFQADVLMLNSCQNTARQMTTPPASSLLKTGLWGKQSVLHNYGIITGC